MRMPDTALPLVARGLGFSAGGTALLREIDLVLEAGPPTLIIGPNGAGKSLLLRLLHGLLQPGAGWVRWQGRAAPRAAMVFQRPVLLRRSVRANAAFPLPLAGVSAADRGLRVAEALALVGLTDLADRPARRLSGGEQQRLALARAAALRPEVLFLDEPCASLDPAATAAAEHIIQTISRQGCKIIMSTHDLGQARRLAGEVVFLHQGRVCEHAAAPQFFQAPSTPQAAAFLNGELLW